MSDCVFCKIVSGEIPNYTVYEDDYTLAFLDITPRAKGHTLVIPKRHALNLLDLDEDSVSKLLPAVKKVQEKIDIVLKPDGYNIGWNHGEAGGQVVPHLHIHIMPRFSGDGGSNMHAIVNNPGSESVEEIFKLFKN
ncbi:MAG: HIT family protein [Candidatus Magasanikbacteria bacterium CG_4_10_14_0_2_um_filter_33_14]|uniref:HIT family protein n=1 Tax=Candidatus Magasanikbacteria bacterium CG_4_10_14_0_2_um_filter_33_14 TaxID=1974636 RepID=A0A2M7V8V2_9BACT|nr:MAG: HIT family protein [Candidatus Magasanikbacteria bacterium CG_4_10_14_0_2_um_filter_33_14]